MKHDYDSTTNQRIKARLVEREVICNHNQLIQHLCEYGAGAWEDEVYQLTRAIDYNYTLDNNGYVIVKYQAAYYWVDTENSDELLGDSFDTKEEAQIDCIQENSLDYEYLEPSEYYGVSDWLATKLREQGEVVVELLGFNVWGRGCTGQAILLDHCISMIATSMEILEGQANDWTSTVS